MRQLRFLPWVTLVLLTFFSAAAHSADTGESVSAIQDRIFQRDHEIGLKVSYLTNNDFYHVYPIGLSYTYHFNDYLAWEVVRGEIMVNQEKDLKKDLEKDFGVTPSTFSEPKYMLHSHLLIKPLYGKSSVWNRSVVNHDTYFFVGGGVVNYERQHSWGEAETETAPSFSFGFGTRYFLSENFNLNFEIRDLVNFKDEKTENYLTFTLGLSFQFNLAPRKTAQDESVKRMKQYLE